MNDLARNFVANPKTVASAKTVANPKAEGINENLMKDSLITDSPDIHSSKMGRILLYTGKITQDELKAIMQTQQTRGLRFGDAAIALGLVTPDDIRAVLATQFAYPVTPSIDSRLDKRLTTAFQPDSRHAEALRSLRSELLLRYFGGTRSADTSTGNTTIASTNAAQNTSPNHLSTSPSTSPLSLALVSAEDAVGTALMAANLAIAFAQLGIRTLLIDANLRQPQVHKLFGVSKRQPGLSDLLAGRANPQPEQISELGSLWVLTAGTQAPNPQELLAHQQYRGRIHSVMEGFGVTLISTAPMNLTRDAQLVAATSGAALLVAREHQSRFKEVARMNRGLQELGVRVLGVALRQ